MVVWKEGKDDVCYNENSKKLVKCEILFLNNNFKIIDMISFSFEPINL